MEQTRLVNLPVIGMVQRGKIEKTPKGTKKVVELNHFVAKVTDVHMEEFLQKFNELYDGKSSIDIEIFDESPLTTKYVRYNQSGAVCSCLTTSNIAHQKTKDGWKEVTCSGECEHRQRNAQGKCNCNRIGWFKFLMPSICKDRIWLMKITGQTSINRLQDYFALQKVQGESLKGHYTLFLKQEEVTDYTGKSYNHYILDIFKKSNISSSNTIPQNTKTEPELSTKTEQTVNNIVKNDTVLDNKNKEKKDNTTTTKNKVEVAEKKEIPKAKITSKKANSTKEINNVATSQVKEKEQPGEKENSLDNCYVLIRTYNKNIKQKNGEDKTYVMGKFYDMEDKQFNVAINPKDAEELQKCDMGTVVKLDLKLIGDVHFALGIDYVEKCEKNVAA